LEDMTRIGVPFIAYLPGATPVLILHEERKKVNAEKINDWDSGCYNNTGNCFTLKGSDRHHGTAVR
jgi:hypothetical protein